MPTKETNYTHFRHLPCEGMGQFFGELAQLFLPDDCRSCIVRERCESTDEYICGQCTAAYTGYLGAHNMDEYRRLRGLSVHFLARWIGHNIGEKIARAGYCDDCPARRVCRNYDTPANGCAEGFERWLRAEYNKEDWPI